MIVWSQFDPVTVNGKYYPRYTLWSSVDQQPPMREYAWLSGSTPQGHSVAPRLVGGWLVWQDHKNSPLWRFKELATGQIFTFSTRANEVFDIASDGQRIFVAVRVKQGKNYESEELIGFIFDTQTKTPLIFDPVTAKQFTPTASATRADIAWLCVGSGTRTSGSSVPGTYSPCGWIRGVKASFDGIVFVVDWHTQNGTNFQTYRRMIDPASGSFMGQHPQLTLDIPVATSEAPWL